MRTWTLWLAMALVGCGEAPADDPVPVSTPAAATPTAAATPAPAATPTPTPSASAQPDAQGVCADGRLVRTSWQGEYPAPIVHVQKAAALPARSGPCALTPDRTCTAAPGVYHPWSRFQAPAPKDVAPFVTVRGIEVWQFAKAHTFGTDQGERTAAVGDELEVLFYAGEGYCELRYDGIVTVDPCPQMWPDGVLQLKAEAPKDETQLFLAGCAEGGTAWLEGSEAIFEQDAVVEGELIEYGRVGPAGGGACGTVVLQGRLGRFEVGSRYAEALPVDNARYTKLVGESLKEDVELQALWKVDLEGDGADEVLFEARGKASELSAIGVRRVGNGAVDTALFGRSDRASTRFRLHGLADVQNDNTLEVVRIEEGSAGPVLQAWSLVATPEQADDERCGW